MKATPEGVFVVSDTDVQRLNKEWSQMTVAQQEVVKARVAELRLRAKATEPFHAEAIEIWRTNSESICDEPQSWVWPDTNSDGVEWAIECACLERLFSPEVMAWERAQRHIEIALADPAISAFPEVTGMLSDVLVCIDWNAASASGGHGVWDWLITTESMQKARSQLASRSARSKNANPRAWVVSNWRARTDKTQSKSAFARQHSALVKAKFRIDVTPDTIARDWLPKG